MLNQPSSSLATTRAPLSFQTDARLPANKPYGYLADLHIHSKYAQGTSSNLDLATLETYARFKGVDLLGTGDFTHPLWNKELKAQLVDKGTGIYYTKTGFPFLLQTELSFAYSQGGKGRRVHLVVLAPTFAAVDKITDYLLQHGRVDYDGRPIFNISCRDFAAAMQRIDNDIEIIPAHIWTPWFGLFGSKSGFDSLQEAFLDKTECIHAIETGLSSDPPMNWRIAELDQYQIVSFSDLHSYWPWRMSREATLFADISSYHAVLASLRTGQGLLGTIEVDPAYGKYHWDGHADCKVRLTPQQSKANHCLCPVCKKPLTIGVEYRVEELATRPVGYIPPSAKPFFTLLPLSDILAAYFGSAPSSKKVWSCYYQLVAGSNEYEVLLSMPQEELAKRSNAEIARAILQNREGAIAVDPGYDGVYGVPLLFGQTAPVDALHSSPSVSAQEEQITTSQSHVQKGMLEPSLSGPSTEKSAATSQPRKKHHGKKNFGQLKPSQASLSPFFE
ncbi:MAG: endonuclease Q family protein [Candidatus Woesearchaeota archaeon]